MRTDTPSILVSVIVVTWNNEDTIRLCLESIISQSSAIKYEIILVDNNSTDKTLVEIQDYPISKIIRNKMNLGFCSANNLGLKETSGEYILLLNPDAVITPGFIDRALRIIEQHPSCAQLAGKIHRMNLDGEPIVVDGKPVIDSVGIELMRDRTAVDIGNSEMDHGQYDEEREIFGVSGAVCFCRRQALRDAMVNEQVFDEEFFAYKEDVDLSWRLNRLGWKCQYSPSLSAFHARGWKYSLQNRQNTSKIVRYHSFKNRHAMILKNETLNSFLSDLVPILWFEIRAFIYVLFREPFLLKSYWDTVQEIPRLWEWRKSINNKIHATLQIEGG